MTKAFVYILQCRDKSLYTGFTTNLSKRLKVHNMSKGAKYTRGRTPVKLVYYEKFPSKARAQSREYEIKQLTRPKKLKLIENFNLSIKEDGLK